MLQLHAKMKRRLIDILKFPSTIRIPDNVRFIGAINVDETTHYFSPKILDRIHVVKFDNPLLFEEQVNSWFENTENEKELIPVYVQPNLFSQREEYPKVNDAKSTEIFEKLKYLNKELELFVQNERVVLECEKDGKIFYMVFVGALNVGQMVFEFEPRVETNKDTKEIKVYTYENIEISKADCLGYFKMGSTVVMIWEKDFVVLENLLNQNVKFGQKIAKY
jgi:hypothetical protein